MTGALLSALRPKQWLKNVLVFGAPAAAGVLDQARELGLTLVVFVSFCAAASGTYLWNDVVDIESDRAHPEKRLRPIAAGAVSLGTARAVGTALLVIGIGLSAFTERWQTVAILAVYVGITLSYSFVLKHVPVVDLVTIAAGFVLRAAAGAAAVDVPMSRWFVLVVTFGSLFVVVGKRYAERLTVGDGAGTRSILDQYTPGYLRILLAVALGGALISYCVWAFETTERAGELGTASDLPWYEATILPVMIALFRYLLVLEQGRGSAPEEVVLGDRVLQVAGLAWIILFGVAVYAG